MEAETTSNDELYVQGFYLDYCKHNVKLSNNGSLPEHKSRSLESDGAGKLVDVERDVQNGLRQIGVEIGHGVTKLFHVLCQQLVGIGYSIVHVAHFVESKT